ncbi:hypothetical protein N431DRAFT_550233 [Stipitochalara longipes BDJ]|nr:hypothetical protein N431DRAFT_550233 [Stipitochalara longipes BDJ]
MLFDFEPFLSKIDPTQKYEFQTLTGGLVNFTVRATKVSPSGGIFSKHNALIVKYAPPFVAALGNSAPFSQDRQVYLGPLLTLYQYFAAIPGEKAGLSYGGQDMNQILGSRIRGFSAELHSPSTRQLASTATSGNLENPVTKDLVFEAGMLTIQEYLAQFKIPDAQMLFHWVLADYQRSNMPEGRCFILGDFTPGAILLAESGDGTQSMGVIDWEFSGEGRGPNGDMLQFLAAIHLLLMAAPPGSRCHNALDLFIQGVSSAYNKHSSRRLEQQDLLMLSKPDAAQAEAVLVQEMVQKGVWYLERAGDSVEEMLDPANLKELIQGDGRVMLVLFGVGS